MTSLELKYLSSIPASERDSFLKQVKATAQDLRIPAVWLLAVMWHESRLNPAAVNQDSGGGGLIGFLPTTASELFNTTVDYLRGLSRAQQLPYVYKYYARHKGRFRDFTDFYLYDFYPYAVGKPNSYIIGSEQSNGNAKLIARENPAFDLNKNGTITLGELRRYIRKKFPEIALRDRVNKILKISGIILIVLIVIVVVVLIYRSRSPILN